MRTIGQHAFKGNKITSINLPASVRVIDNEAFANNQITSLTIPNGVERIMVRSFDGNPLTTLVIPASLYDAMYNPFPDTLTRVTLPANSYAMEALGESLRNFYIRQGRRAGVYVKNGSVWTRQ